MEVNFASPTKSHSSCVFAGTSEGAIATHAAHPKSHAHASSSQTVAVPQPSGSNSITAASSLVAAAEEGRRWGVGQSS